MSDQHQHADTSRNCEGVDGLRSCSVLAFLLVLLMAGGFGGVGYAQTASAQYHMSYFWSVVDGSTTLQPGERVTLQLNAMRTPGWPDTRSYFGGMFTILIGGWSASDALATNTDGSLGRENLADTRTNYLGRKPDYRNFPDQLGFFLQSRGDNFQELVSDRSDQSIVHTLLAGR